MFTTHIDDRDYVIKPMNCPGHVQIFNQGLKSYRDLPLRIAEFGLVHRNEPSGTLHGLLRARRFTQDDAHVFCTQDQLREEVATLIDLTYRMYRDFGFEDIEVALSTRPDERVGEDALWDVAEDALAQALVDKKIPYKVQNGEGAFYGPKIDLNIRDAIGRSWQCTTVQFDFNLPKRFGLSYIGEDGAEHQPLMVHRVIFGSLERFMGILIEHYGGAFPLWLAPVQATIIPISDRHLEYARSVNDRLLAVGIRVETNDGNERMNAKIRQAQLQKIPYMLIVGDREIEAEAVGVRLRSGEDLGALSLSDIINRIHSESENRVL